MTNLERAIKDGYAHIIGEKLDMNFDYLFRSSYMPV